MPTLSNAELAAMRNTVNAWMDATATIQRNTPASDGAGGSTDSWGNVGTVNCYVLDPTFSQEDYHGGRIQGQSLYPVVLPLGTVVNLKDRLVIAGLTYEIAAADFSKSDPIDVEVLCVLINQGG